MRAHILSIGSELILGHLTDTNATFLAQEMVGLGIELLHVTQVGDDRARLVASLRAAADGADLVVCTGGVGPTDDDLTREATAEMVGETPTVDPTLLDGIRAYFAGRGLTMPDQNAKQAWVIPSAEVLPNPVGTAPGWFVRHEGRSIVTMPGVPREMHRMWREEAVPRLRSLLPARVVQSGVLKTLGIGESAVAQMLDDLIKREHPVVATYAKDDGVQIRFTAVGATPGETEAEFEPVFDEGYRRLRAYVYAKEDASLPVVLVDLLRARGLTLGIAEVGSGARFASLMWSDPASAEVVTGSDSVSNPESSPDGTKLAVNARERFSADLGLASVASFGSPERGIYPATITIALAGAVSTVETFPLQAAYVEVQRRAALHAADVLRRALVEG